MIKTILDNKYLIKPITSLNHNEIKQLNQLCSDYNIMCSGREVTDEDIYEIFEYSDKKTKENSLTLGVYNEHELLIGMIDVFKNYPEDGIWMIGLLLLSTDERNKRLGKIIHEELKTHALNSDAHTFRIGVVDKNIKARKFWESVGYEKIKSATITMGNKDQNIDILKLNIK